MRKYYATGKSVSERNKTSKKMFKKANQKKSAFGMLSVKAGIDKNPNPTQVDRIAGAKMGNRKKAMGGGMMRKPFRKGGDTHVTKEGKTARKGLWYNIHQKRKRGEKMRKKGAKGAPTAEAIKKNGRWNDKKTIW